MKGKQAGRSISRPSPRSSRGRRSGFTLLEVIIALAIITIIGTIFAVNFAGEAKGESLRETSLALRKMAMTANRQSAAYRDELRITLFPDAFFLSRAPIVDRRNAPEAASEQFVVREDDDERVLIQIRRLGNPKWIPPEAFPWVFQPAGLSEPLEVRLSSNEGWIELRFNPMTATVDEEYSVFE